LSTAKILIIEDREDVRNILHQQLVFLWASDTEDKGNIEIAMIAEELFTKLAKWKTFDMIITDYDTESDMTWLEAILKARIWVSSNTAGLLSISDDVIVIGSSWTAWSSFCDAMSEWIVQWILNKPYSIQDLGKMLGSFFDFPLRERLLK